MIEPFVTQVLRATADFDLCSDIYWTVDTGDKPHFFVNCNDLFEWACADAEEITPGNLQLLIDTYAELKSTNWPDPKIPSRRYPAEVYTDSLWACRVRGWRPQRAYYEHLCPELAKLFDAAERKSP